MKKYKFVIELDENDLIGDEFWEDALKSDSTGVRPLTVALEGIIQNSYLIIGSEKKPSDVIKLIEYKDE